MLSKARLEKNYGMSVNEGAINYKILTLNLENSLYWQNVPCVVP